jgi:integrase
MARKGQTKRKDKDRIVLKKGECQRSNGTYHFCWTDKLGKRHFIYAPTLEELREKEAAVEKDNLDGIKAEARYVTINELFDLWCQLKRGLKNNTFENYKYMYNTFVRPNFGKLRISTLKKADVKRFYNHLADERGLQASTIDSVHTVLHQVLNMAVDDAYIRSNPSDGVLKELKQSHVFKTEKRRGLTKPEQELLLSFLKNHPVYNHWYPIFAVMVGTGLRVGELAGLRWCDIDLDEGIIDILREIDTVVIAILINKVKGGYKLSMRSKDSRYPVGPTARKFGGGGHDLAAGATIPANDVRQVLDTIIPEFEKLLEN